MTVCAACGTDNRDKARYCRGCARPLSPGAGPAPEDGAPAATATRQRRRTPHETPADAGAAPAAGATHRRVLVGLAVLVMGSAAVWWALQPGATTAAPPVVAVAPPVIAPPEPLAVSVEAVRPVAALSAPTQAAPEQAGVVGPQTGQSPVANATREPKVPVERERVPRAGPRNALQPAAVPPREAARPAEPAAATPVVAAASAPAPVPAPAQTVEQTCADSSNFLSRDLCRVRACRNPAVAGDPVCVRFREMEAASRSRTDQ